jgi:hypothetical protein
VISVLGVGIGGPAVQNDSVLEDVVCATDSGGKTKIMINRNKTAILIIVEVDVSVSHRKCQNANKKVVAQGGKTLSTSSYSLGASNLL